MQSFALSSLERHTQFDTSDMVYLMILTSCIYSEIQKIIYLQIPKSNQNLKQS